LPRPIQHKVLIIIAESLRKHRKIALHPVNAGLGEMAMLKGFRDFLMRGDVIVVAVGLSVALAFSNLGQGVHR
jgi:hypothetical protein